MKAKLPADTNYLPCTVTIVTVRLLADTDPPHGMYPGILEKEEWGRGGVGSDAKSCPKTLILTKQAVFDL